MELPSSFWIDEMGTVFVVRMGAHHPSLSVAPQVPASLYFWLARGVEWILAAAPAWARSPGFLEAFFRVPSVVCMAAALWVIARIAARLIGPQAAWFAAFACLALKGFDYQAADARPYALGTLVAAGSVLFLIRWLDDARWWDAVLFAGAAALLWRVHLIYWPFYAVFAAYAGLRLARHETAVGWRRAAAVFAILGVLLVPVLIDAISLFRQAGAHVIVALPGMSELWRALKVGLIALCTAGAWCLARFSGSRRNAEIAKTSWVLIVAWWLAQPLALFFFSRITGSSVFVDRYLSLALPGAALVATAGADVFLDAAKWRAATLVLGAGVLLFLGQWRELWPPHHNSQWREAAQAINGLEASSGLTVIAPSPFIEARAPAWSPSYALPGFLYAHLLVYPVAGEKLLWPYDGGFSDDHLADRKRFVIYGPYGGVRPAVNWFRTRSPFDRWRHRRLGNFGDVEAVLFEAP